MSGRRFAVVLLLIVAGAFGLRVMYLHGVTSRPETHFYDWIFYRGEARALARGHGFVQPSLFANRPDSTLPAADHPPILAMLLAPVSKLSHDSDFALRMFNCIVGAMGVGLIGLLGRAIGGRGIGIAAAGISALYPNLWVHDALIMSESLTVALATLAVLLTFEAVRRPRLRTAIALGAVSGLGALTRSELILLFPLLCVPAFLVPRSRAGLKLLATAALAALLVVGPWVTYNVTRFERPVLIATNWQLNLLGSSCPDAMHGPLMGGLGTCTLPKSLTRFLSTQVPSDADESVIGAAEQKRAFALIRGDLAWYPVVVLARIGRTWSLFRPLDDLRVGVSEDRPRWVTALGLFWYYPLLGLAGFGVWLRRRRGLLVWPLLVPPLIVTVSMLGSYGQNRYRVEAEPVIVVLAAQAVVVATGRLRHLRTQPGAPAPAE